LYGELESTMNRIPIFHCCGRYFGFVHDSHLFDVCSNYHGWIEQDGTVWRSDGMFLGEVIDTHYILKRQDIADPISKPPRPIPSTPIPPLPAKNRLEHVPSVGWTDVLDSLKHE
jgi:hypothetical protein